MAYSQGVQKFLVLSYQKYPRVDPNVFTDPGLLKMYYADKEWWGMILVDSETLMVQ